MASLQLRDGETLVGEPFDGQLVRLGDGQAERLAHLYNANVTHILLAAASVALQANRHVEDIGTGQRFLLLREHTMPEQYVGNEVRWHCRREGR